MIGLESPTARRASASAARHVAATPVKVGRRVDFGVKETPVVGRSGGNRNEVKTRTLIEATPVKKSLSPFGIFGKRVGGDADADADEVGGGVGGVDLVGGKSIYDVWNDDDYEELA